VHVRNSGVLVAPIEARGNLGAERGAKKEAPSLGLQEFQRQRMILTLQRVAP